MFSNFASSTAYDIPVIRPDGSIVKGDGNFQLGFDTVTSDAQGSFLYQYILNGIEGLYEVRVYNSPWSGNLGETPVASVTFTDSAGITHNQCQPGPESGSNGILSNCIDNSNPNGWKNGLNSGPFNQGDSLPYRAKMIDTVVGETYTLAIEYDITKGGEHAIDYPTTFNRTMTNADPYSDHGDATICAIATPENESATATSGPPRSSRT